MIHLGDRGPAIRPLRSVDAGTPRMRLHCLTLTRIGAMMDQNHSGFPEAEERWTALQDLDEWLRTPMMVLSSVWLVLVIVELVWGQAVLLRSSEQRSG